MEPEQERELNQSSYRRLKDFINGNYPAGRFLAIAEGKIVADAEGFEELNGILNQAGNRYSEALVVQAGVEYPESVTIFLA